MKNLVAPIAILLTLIYAGTQFGASEQGLTVVVPISRGLTANVILGVEERQNPFQASESGTTTIYTNDLYRLQISTYEAQPRNIIRVRLERLSGEPFRMSNFSLLVRFPRSTIQGIWYPSANTSSSNVMVTDANHSIEDIAAANYGIPYLAAASSDSRNSFAMGFGSQDLAVSIAGKPFDRNSYEFRLKAVNERTVKVFDERFYVSTDASLTWFETAENYADWVDRLNNYRPFPISPHSYKPLYDTWYWSGDHVDERLYAETARLASELGFGSYLADSGWDAAAGEYEKWLSGTTGDYTPPPDKFNNLPATFDQFRSEYKLGINLWLQPFAVGRESQRYPETRDMHIQIPKGFNQSLGWTGLASSPFALPLGQNIETVNLCPRMIPTQTYLKNLFNEMTAKYKPEGYWLDFIDGMATYCIAPHAHDQAAFGDGLKKALQTIKTTILSANPKAVVQFRARYANLNTKSFANVFQTGDSPGDFDSMRLGSIRLRPFSKGVVFAADQLYWPDTTDEVSVSKFIATSMMIGVPAFGPTLIYSPPGTIAMLKAWLTFYDQYKLHLANGRFSPFGQLKVPNHKIEGRDHTFVYIRNLDFSELPVGGKTIFIVNASNGDYFNGKIRGPANLGTYSVKVFDRYLGQEPNQFTLTTNSEGVLNLHIAVEQGGMIVLSGKENTEKILVTNGGPDDTPQKEIDTEDLTTFRPHRPLAIP